MSITRTNTRLYVRSTHCSLLGQVHEVISYVIRVFLGFTSGWRCGFMSLTTTRARINAEIALKFFVRSLQGFILGGHCGFTSLATSDALSKLD